MPESWLDLHLQRRIQELRAIAAAEELEVVLIRECVALAKLGTPDAKARIAANLRQIAVRRGVS